MQCIEDMISFCKNLINIEEHSGVAAEDQLTFLGDQGEMHPDVESELRELLSFRDYKNTRNK